MAERVSNSFNGGMSQDIEKMLRNNDSYSESVNGRLIYNNDGSLSWEAMDGNISCVSGLPSNAIIQGHYSFNDITVIFLFTKQSQFQRYSAIGYIYNDNEGFGHYRELYNDYDDTFSKDLKLFGRLQTAGIQESETLYRVYFTDDREGNEPRCFTFERFKNVGGNDFRALSDTSHKMDLSPDWNMGELWIYQQIDNGGCLEVAMYQYTYRCVLEEGYVTPWFPLTRHVMVHGATGDDGWKANMSDIGDKTSKANELRIDNLDTRYDRIQVAYVKSIAAESPIEAKIFFNGEITNENMTIFHREDSGQALVLESIINKVQFVNRARTVEVKDNRLWFGNIENNPITEVPDSVFKDLTVEPIFRSTWDDVNDAAADSYEDKGILYRKRVPVNLWESKYKNRNGDYVQRHRHGKWTSYCDSMVEHAHTGYFRGEIYRFGIVFFDKKGNDMFVQHLADVRFPNQVDNITYYVPGGNPGGKATLWWTRVKNDGGKQNGQWTSDDNEVASVSCNYLPSMIGGEADDFEVVPALWCPSSYIGTNREITNVGYREEIKGAYLRKVSVKYMGVRFGGINLNATINGKKLTDLVGGFKIVRVAHNDETRIIQRQGIYAHLVEENVRSKDYNKDYSSSAKDVTPNPFPSFNWYDGTHWGSFLSGSPGYYDGEGDNSKNAHSSWSSYGAFICPDIEFEEAAPEQESDSAMQVVNNCWSTSYNTGEYGTGYKSGSWFTSMIGQPVANIPNRISSVPSNWTSITSTPQLRGIPVHRRNGSYGENWHHYHHKLHNTRNKQVNLKDSSNSGRKTSLRGSVTIGGANLGKNWQYIKLHDGNLNYTVLPNGQDFYPVTHTFGKNRQNNEYSTNTGTYNIFSRKFKGKEPGGEWLQAALAPNISIITTPVGGLGSAHFGSLIANNNYKCVAAYPTLNWITPRNFSSAFGGQSKEALESNIFETTGHYQIVYSGNYNGNLNVFDDIDVWGGDCYVQMHASSLLMPLIDMDEDDCTFLPEGIGDKEKMPGGNSRVKWFRDYSFGLSYIIESKYNFAMAKTDQLEFPTYGQVGHSSGAYKSYNWGNYTNHERQSSAQKFGLYYGGKFPGKKKDPIEQICRKRVETSILNKIVLHKEGLRWYFPKPATLSAEYNFPSRWIWSEEKKPYGEWVDRFRRFEEAQAFDLDGTHGEITASAKLFDNLYSFQERGVGRLRAGDRAMVSTNAGDSLVLGDSGVMDGVDYITTKYGVHKSQTDTVVASNKHIYFLDGEMSKLFSFGQEGLRAISDEKGLHSFFANKTKGMAHRRAHGGFDWKHNEYYLTILGGERSRYDRYDTIGVQSGGGSGTGNISARVVTQAFTYVGWDDGQEAFTIVYNEDMQLFTTEVSILPNSYMSIGKYFYSHNSDEHKGEIYLHNYDKEPNVGKFYNRLYNSYIKYSINKYPSVSKYFDNHIMNINSDFNDLIDQVYIESNEDSTITADINMFIDNENRTGYVPNSARAEYKAGLLRFPLRDSVRRAEEGKRISGKSADISYMIQADGVKKPSLTSADTLVRVIQRI